MFVFALCREMLKLKKNIVALKSLRDAKLSMVLIRAMAFFSTIGYDTRHI